MVDILDLMLINIQQQVPFIKQKSITWVTKFRVLQ